MPLVSPRCPILQFPAGKVSQTAQGLGGPETHPERRPATHRHQAAEGEANPITAAVLGSKHELARDSHTCVCMFVCVFPHTHVQIKDHQHSYGNFNIYNTQRSIFPF